MMTDAEMDALLRLIDDLIVQATTENSHYYTEKVLRLSAAAIRELRSQLEVAEREITMLRTTWTPPDDAAKEGKP